MRKVHIASIEDFAEWCGLRTGPSAGIWYFRCETLNILKTRLTKERLEKIIDSEWSCVWEFMKVAGKRGSLRPSLHKNVASKYAYQARKQLSLQAFIDQD